MNETWIALAREAGIAAEHMAIGATALGKANYVQHAYYSQAFFALTIGFERAAKLALVADHAIDHGGAFPSHTTLHEYGHNLRTLLGDVDKIAKCRHFSGEHSALPDTAIHEGIVGVLSDFAMNITRYYNLDLVTGDLRAAQRHDPVRSWFDRVTIPVLAEHFRPHHQKKNEQNAMLVQQMLEGIADVHYHSESGDPLDSIYETSLHSGITEFARPYTRMYVMQIARFLGNVLSELGTAGYSLHQPIVPYFSDFFAIFNNSDKYFRKRKGWSIYRP